MGADLVWPSALLFTAMGERVAIVGSFDAAVVPGDLYDRVVSYTEGIAAPLRAELDRIAPRTIGINESKSGVGADGLTSGRKALLLEVHGPTPHAATLVSAELLVGRLRGRKSPLEQMRIRRAVRITEGLFDELDGFLAVGQTEREIQAFVHRRMAELGVGFAWQAESNPAVDAGPDKPFGHGVPDEVAHAFATVRDAVARAAEVLRPGVRTRCWPWGLIQVRARRLRRLRGGWSGLSGGARRTLHRPFCWVKRQGPVPEGNGPVVTVGIGGVTPKGPGSSGAGAG